MIWNILGSRAEARNPETQEQLQEIIKKEWEKIPQETINHVLGKIKKTIPLIISQKEEYV